MSHMLPDDLEKIYESPRDKFYEKTPAPSNDHEYSRTHKDQGLVLIFNQVNFAGCLEQRLGSNQDVNNIISALSKLGYNVNFDHVFVDYDRRQIMQEIETRRILNNDNSKRNCLIVIFLSHGDSNNTIYAKNGSMSVEEIISKFSQWELFDNQPKLFIFQACKGSNRSPDPGNEHFILSTSLPPDVVVYFSSVEDKVSHRNTFTGTWLIEELCNIFLMFGKKEDVLNLLHRTSKCVATLVTSDEEYQLRKQMPVIFSSLRKKFYLTNSKENIHNEATINYIQQQQNEVEDLRKQILNVLNKS